MRIISKFIDYYDSVQGVMYDSNTLYIRKSISKSVTLKGHTHHNSDDFGLTFIVIAGNVYTMFRAKYRTNYSDERWMDRKYTYYKDVDSIRKDYLKLKNYDEEWIKKQFYTNGFWNKSIIETAKSLSSEISELSDAPIYVVNTYRYDHVETELIENPCLKDYQFQSVLDPYTIYQELSMWFGNRCVQQYPPQITDNKVNIERHGFDYKTSFRQSPTKKRKR